MPAQAPRAGDRDALPLATESSEGYRSAASAGSLHLLEQIRDTASCAMPCHPSGSSGERFTDDLTHGKPRTQRGVWVLIDQLHQPGMTPPSRAIEAGKADPSKRTSPLPRSGKAEGNTGDRGFTGTGFADEAECFAGPDREADRPPP